MKTMLSSEAVIVLEGQGVAWDRAESHEKPRAIVFLKDEEPVAKFTITNDDLAEGSLEILA